jgi:zinc-ribbon domain
LSEGSGHLFCENCGTEIRPAANFCTNCGVAQKPDQQGAGQAERSAQDGLAGGTRYFYRKTPATISTRLAIIVMGIFLLLLASGVVLGHVLPEQYTAWLGASQPTPPPSEQTATQESSTPSEQTAMQESSTPSEQTATSNDEDITTTSNSNRTVVVPTGYVLEEDCQQGVGATGKTIYYRPPLPPEEGGRMHTYWFECVHRSGASPIVNVVSSPSSGGVPEILGAGGPYCAFSTVDKNIGCTLSPITEEDLMNPPTGVDTQSTTTVEKTTPIGRGVAPLSDSYRCPPGYPIKGNISQNTSEKIYHEPGWRFYDVTKPEECFATESDAESAGYRPSKIQ